MTTQCLLPSPLQWAFFLWRVCSWPDSPAPICCFPARRRLRLWLLFRPKELPVFALEWAEAGRERHCRVHCIARGMIVFYQWCIACVKIYTRIHHIYTHTHSPPFILIIAWAICLHHWSPLVLWTQCDVSWWAGHREDIICQGMGPSLILSNPALFNLHNTRPLSTHEQSMTSSNHLILPSTQRLQAI